VGSTWRESAVAVGPALASVLGIVALALPVSLLLSPGPLSLVAILASGVVGSLLALLLLARPTLVDIRGLLDLVLRPKSPT
jgi:hypothetical protein